VRIGRREFLGRAAGLSAAAAAPRLAGLVMLDRARTAARGRGGYGPLEPSPDCPEIALPRSFRCWKLSVAGEPMTGGAPSPQGSDGMAAFALPNGNIRLIRNQELNDPPERSAPLGDPALAYDPIGCGGTVSLEVRVRGDGVTAVREFVSLGGTLINCAGGPTPWGTWLSCEETTKGAAQGWQREHGFVFEVPVAAESQVPAVPIPAMGRFEHEAAAVDPSSGIVYLTEDREYRPALGRPGSALFRYIPRQRGQMRSGGRLQAVAVRGSPRYETYHGQRAGVPLECEWVDVREPNPRDASSDPSAVFRQVWQRGAAVFQRLEGCWFGDGAVYLNATSGGDAGLGQVWQYRPRTDGTGVLTLIFESRSRQELNRPDNITTTSRGGLLVCEDNGSGPFLRGITREGAVFDFAQNLANNNEWAGACFSPDEETLFVNLQGLSTRARNAPSLTLAIRGPWSEGSL
jgi:secreted PhoX family phosphatase